MSDLPPARTLRRRGDWAKPYARVLLDYDARFLRRKRLRTEQGEAFLVDLAETVSLEHGDALELEDGRLIEVAAVAEPVVVVTGDLPRLAWHIGNRHTPCQIERDRLLILRDHVLEAMLSQLGAGVAHATERFTPEGGAYGVGRTMGHEHGPAHDHDHPHDHDHSHGHRHVHHHSGHRHATDEDDNPPDAD